MNNNQIQYTINGINYILIEIPCPSESVRIKISTKMYQYDAILQSAKPISSFWWKNYIKLKILVPEKHVLQFSLERMED